MDSNSPIKPVAAAAAAVAAAAAAGSTAADERFRPGELAAGQLQMSEKSKILRRDDNQRSFDTGTSLASPSSAGPDWDAGKIDDADEEDGGEFKSNLAMTAFNVINSIIGSGVIGMPYALKNAGIGLGLLLLVLVSVITDYSVNLIIMGGALSNTRTYQEMVRVAFGKSGFLIITAMQAVYPFIAMVSYNVIIGDTITQIIVRIGGSKLENTVLADRNFVVFLTTIAVSMPLCYFKNIARLTKTSLLSTGIICIVIAAMTIRAPVYASEILPSQFEWTFANSRIPQAVAIMAFAFMCQHNSYLCFHSLKGRTLQRWALVVHLAVGFSMLVSALFGLIGFATFASTVQGDILENYCPKDDLINLSRFLFSITIMLTFPMECFVVREVIENYFFNQPPPLWRHIALTTGIVAAAYAISTATSCVGVILEINGVLTAAPLAFILPPLSVMRLQNEAFFQWKNAPLLATTAFGIIVAVSGFAVVVMDIFNGVKCSRGEEMHYCLSNHSRLGIYA